MSKELKVWIGGFVIGGIICGIIVALAVSAVWATAFINAGLIK
jgi:hypothetical protein